MLNFGKEAQQDLKGMANRAVTALEKAVDRRADIPVPAGDESSSPRGGDYVPMTVETFDNHIYFYAKVDTDRCLDLIQRIRNVDNELRRQQFSRMLPEGSAQVPIWLHIQSFGGELFTGFNIADQLQTIQTPIYSVIEGVCASAATLISMSCTRRYMMPSSYMLIHQLSSWMMNATHEEFKDELHLQDMLMERLYRFYASRTNFNKSQVKKLLKRDTWFDAVECLENGLVDQIYGQG